MRRAFSLITCGFVAYWCHEKKSMGTFSLTICSRNASIQYSPAKAGPPIFSCGKHFFRCLAAME